MSPCDSTFKPLEAPDAVIPGAAVAASLLEVCATLRLMIVSGDVLLALPHTAAEWPSRARITLQALLHARSRRKSTPGSCTHLLNHARDVLLRCCALPIMRTDRSSVHQHATAEDRARAVITWVWMVPFHA